MSKAEKLEEIRVTVEKIVKANEYEYETHINFKEKTVLLKLRRDNWRIDHIFGYIEYDMLVDMNTALNFQVGKLIKQLEAARR